MPVEANIYLDSPVIQALPLVDLQVSSGLTERVS